MSDPAQLAAQARYAVYFSPQQGSAWAEAGARWLGRCIDRGQPLAQPLPSGWSAEAFAAITRTPRRYGWHATLKAPFRLGVSRTEAELLFAFRELAKQMHGLELPSLKVQQLGSFLALVPQQPSAALQALAQRCVVDLHDFAATPDEDDITARIAQGKLDAEQQALLRRWGYPHVLHRFRFHLTLTGDLRKLSAAQIAALQAHASAQFSILPQPVLVQALSLCIEPRTGADFLRIAQAELA
jgi:hypothetical protein